MCGIGGFSISDTEHRLLKSRDLAAALTNRLVVRGRDATGAAWVERGEDGKPAIYYAKDAVPAQVLTRDYPRLMPRYPRAAILHTRYATQGSPSNNANNHPILIPDKVIGIHNGVIVNDDDLFAEHGWERIAQVDSEAIFQLIGHATKPLKALTELEGRAAIAWFGVNDPQTLHLARLEGSPLFVAYTHGGSTMFASTDDILHAALADCGIKPKVVYEVPEWTYMRIVRGKIVNREALKTEDPMVARARQHAARVVGMPKRWEPAR